MARILIDFIDFGTQKKTESPLFDLLSSRHELLFSDYPDFLIYNHERRRHKLYSCTKIYYTPECYLPNWNKCDYAILVRKINDPRAFHLPYYALHCDPSLVVRSGSEDWRDLLRTKNNFCSFVTGYDDKTVRNRVRFFHNLHAKKAVDSGGRALNNIGRKIPMGIPAKVEFLKDYKFNIAFENNSIPGYTTEKIVDAFCAKTVPIYWGDPQVNDQFNPEAFINRSDFDSDESCIEYILKVDADDDLYLKHLSASPFYNNQPNKEFDTERLLDFFDSIFFKPQHPVAQRGWFSRLTKWRLVRRVQTLEELGFGSANERAKLNNIESESQKF